MVADGRVWQIRGLLEEAYEVAGELQRELPPGEVAQPHLALIRRYAMAGLHNVREIEEKWRNI